MGQRERRLEGKIAIATGAGTATEIDGTGQATAILFARKGANSLGGGHVRGKCSENSFGH